MSAVHLFSSETTEVADADGIRVLVDSPGVFAVHAPAASSAATARPIVRRTIAAARLSRRYSDVVVDTTDPYDTQIACYPQTMPRRPASTPVDDTASWRPQPGRRTSILFDIFRVGQATRTLVAEAMQDAELRPDEYAAYSVVFEMGPITLTELSAQLAMPLTTLADHVRTMTERGHLRRKVHPMDQRAFLLALTPEGLRTHRRAARSFERAYRALVRELGPLDEDTAREVLQQLARSAERAAGTLPARRTGRAG
jgi:DNA-binding MarR family transcriptional regulator